MLQLFRLSKNMALIEVVRYMAQNTHQMMLYLMFCGGVMDTTINLDEELLAHAQD